MTENANKLYIRRVLNQIDHGAVRAVPKSDLGDWLMRLRFEET